MAKRIRKIANLYGGDYCGDGNKALAARKNKTNPNGMSKLVQELETAGDIFREKSIDKYNGAGRGT